MGGVGNLRIALAVTALLPLAGCVGPGSAANEAEPSPTLMSVWEQRRDMDYFEYEAFAEARVEYDESEATVPVPTDAGYVAVRIVPWQPDPYTAVLPEPITIKASWADGSRAFEYGQRSCCGGQIPPDPSGYRSYEGASYLLRAPESSPGLTLQYNTGSPGDYVVVTVERAWPMTYTGEPPYVSWLDADYFTMNQTDAFRVDHPGTSAAQASATVREFNASFPFVFLEADFFGTEVSSAWLWPELAEWPGVRVTWDGAGESVLLEAELWSSSRGQMGDTQTRLLATPAGATSLTVEPVGWGEDQYVHVRVFGAVPVDPMVPPEAGGGPGGRTSQG